MTVHFNVDRRFGLQTIQKAGSSAIQNAIVKSGLWYSQITEQQYHAMPERYVFIREPYERFVSAYRMFRDSAGTPWDLDTSHLDDYTFEVIHRYKNGKLREPHTMSQYAHLCAGRAIHPKGMKVIRWDFSKVAELLGIDKIEPYNTKGSKDNLRMGPAARNAFEDYYMADRALWEGDIEGLKYI